MYCCIYDCVNPQSRAGAAKLEGFLQMCYGDEIVGLPLQPTSYEAHIPSSATSVVEVHVINLWLLTIQVEVQGDCDSLEEVYSQSCLLTSHDAHCRDYYIKTQHLLAATSSVEQFQQTLQELIVPDMPFFLHGL